MSTKKPTESKRRTGRPPKHTEPVQKTHLEIEVTTLEALDEWVAELREEVPGGGGITRSDLIRDLLARAVKERRSGRRRAR